MDFLTHSGVGELTRETTPEDGVNFSETKQHMDELATHIDTNFYDSAKTIMSNLIVGELEKLKEEVRNLHLMTTEEIDTLKRMMNTRAEDIDTLKHSINLIKLDVKNDVKKLFDMEWKSKKEIQKMHDEMHYQLHQINVATALTVSNMMAPLTEQLKSFELKMHNLEANTTAVCNQMQENTTAAFNQQISNLMTEMSNGNKQNIDLISENRKNLDEMQMDLAMSTLNSKRMVEEMEMEIAMKLESLEEIEAEMKSHSSKNIQNLHKRIEIIAFALSTMDNKDVFSEAVNALNQVEKLNLGPPAKAMPTAPAKAFPTAPPKAPPGRPTIPPPMVTRHDRGC